MISLTVNGDTRRTAASTIAELVRELDLDPAKVAVERNGTIAPRSELAAIGIADGDTLEIVHFVGGGDKLCGIHGLEKLCAHFVTNVLQCWIAVFFVQQLPDNPPCCWATTLKGLGDFTRS